MKLPKLLRNYPRTRMWVHSILSILIFLCVLFIITNEMNRHLPEWTLARDLLGGLWCVIALDVLSYGTPLDESRES